GAVKIYLGGPMFVSAEVRYNVWLAGELRSRGFDVYCPNESEPINDKTRSDITPRKIYDADREALEDANIYLCQVSEDSGTNWEAGYFDCLSRYVDSRKYLGVIGLATDIRLAATPVPEQVGVDNLAWSINAFVIGGLQRSLGIVGSEDELFLRLDEIWDAAEQGTLTDREA
ncbi:MAG TPA: nucleoside 2-deoxyribosyltransferase, partial [Thermomicrobiales bacterium]|nr:nucleoside 2-deoxyribosyltransferase [Thermomicrobiales bacterium]